MIYTRFKIGFWHPFGPHGRETPAQIFERKRQEIEANGWTLWSFQYRRLQVLDEWSRHLLQAGDPKVIVFCSHSLKAVDPAETGNSVEITDCQSYRLVGEAQWQPWPHEIRVPHPFRDKRKHASAFVVQRIIHPAALPILPSVEWLSKGQWMQDKVPTRGEYLIRPGGMSPMRQVSAVLELRAPYLAVVSVDQPSNCL